MYTLIILKKIEWFFIRLFGLKKFKQIGNCTQVQYGIFSDTQNIVIGDYVYIGEECRFHGFGGINIQDGTIIGPHVVIRSSNHDYKTGDAIPYGFGIEKRAVFIGKNCWIGEGAYITPGTIIGEGVIVGMGSVVSGEVPAGAIVVGNPAIIKKYRNPESYKLCQKDSKIYLKLKKNV